jgi:iron complex outermembrane recepter protein
MLRLVGVLGLILRASALEAQPSTVPPAPEAVPVPEPAPVPGPEPEPAPAPEAAPPTAPVSAAPESAEDPEVTTLFEVVAVVPSGLTMDRIPRNVARLDRATLDKLHPLGVHDAMNQRLSGVVLNDVQNNPLQPDLQYRGYTASPLLGSPQGLAVYQNGVRINDPFGDIVQWDLVPEFAIQEIDLVPGADPLHGLNALGGGLVLRMKDGFHFEGYRVSGLAGSFGRYQTSAEWGQVSPAGVAFYAGISAFGESGFRDESRSSARHAYADVRQRGDDHEVGLNLTIADTDLRGNGPVPIELLEQDRSAVFTYPDITQNDLLMVSADASHDLGSGISLQARAYVRVLARSTVNGDEAEFETCPAAEVPDAQVLCDDDGMPLLSEAGRVVPSPEVVPYTGVYNTTQTDTDGYGGTAQIKFEEDLLQRPNQLIFGLGYDGGAVDFLQRAELGRLTEDRSVAGEGIFIANDGFRTKLQVDTHMASAFFVDTFTPLDPLSLQVAGRVHYIQVGMHDLAGTELDGDHHFERFDPALGLTFRAGERMTLFASYSESSRAPSAVELACADPEQPCRLPNAFIADPPLDQVVTRGVEAGWRGSLGGSHARPTLDWSLAGFASRNHDDILFVAGSRIGTGYFRNAGNTQRVGLEVGVNGRTGPVRMFASYTLLRATFESALVLPGAANPEARPADDATAGAPDNDEDEEGGVIDVEKGDRIPGLPTHSLKAGIAVSPLRQLELGLSAIVQSSRPFRGDEANLIGDVPGYAVFEAYASYAPLDALEVFVKAQNLLDTEYETFGVLADPSEVLEGTSDPRFLGPAAPFGIWAGVVLH